ncbi:1,2-phenylacetyl-CoA epoxidase subunit PaaD [Streptacidiphilus rugosus]|uniref:1,2-phenylacetyl-CoA epoxidase subunit PaaD n=1 Tax=Streptacidiphilus rugosus TaxID=405783 RepID=UPI00056C08E3|nr:1,2-phenylacetyl-CoA epoxidase subunit PaaD [Streptacidiphilus rugosus]
MTRPPGGGVDRAELARRVVALVRDPLLRVVTVSDLGVLRGVAVDAAGHVTVELTPTYGGCPAVAAIRVAIRAELRAAGFDRVDVVTLLVPAWSSDWITPEGRRKLARHGIAPPSSAPNHDRSTPLCLGPLRPAVRCPRCRSLRTREVARYGPTACTELRSCRDCRESFAHVKEV